MKLHEKLIPILERWNLIKEDVRRDVESGDTNEDGFWDEVADFFRSIAETLGLERIGSGTYKVAYSMPDLPFVVKIHDEEEYVDLDSSDPDRTPFAHKIVRHTFQDKMLIIQPKVDDSWQANEDAYEQLEKEYGQELLNQYDVHQGNVGLLDGKAVIFDFWVDSKTEQQQLI